MLIYRRKKKGYISPKLEVGVFKNPPLSLNVLCCLTSLPGTRGGGTADLQADEDGQLQALRALSPLSEVLSGQRGGRASAQPPGRPHGVLGRHRHAQPLLQQRQDGERGAGLQAPGPECD